MNFSRQRTGAEVPSSNWQDVLAVKGPPRPNCLFSVFSSRPGIIYNGLWSTGRGQPAATASRLASSR